MTDSDSLLAKYLSEMAAIPVMTPAEETAAAQAVVEAEADLWAELLSYGPAATLLLEQLEIQICAAPSDQRPALEPLLVARKAAGRSRAVPLAAARALGLSLRTNDIERTWTSSAVQLALALAKPPSQYEEDRDILDPTEEYQAWCDRLRRADRHQRRAKERFFNANLRLVVSIARRYHKGRVAFLDLVQDGNLGLMRAVERFDHTLGYRFSTYASWWIRHALSRHLADKSRAVRVPVHMLDAKLKMDKAAAHYLRQHGVEPNDEELVQLTGLTLEKVEQCRHVVLDNAASLDKPIGDDPGGSTMLDRLADASPTPLDNIEAREWLDESKALLNVLTPVERAIIRWRFGLEGEEELTLSEIGDKFLLTRERIRQLQERAVEKMRKKMRFDHHGEVA